jgi:hypothetical protein
MPARDDDQTTPATTTIPTSPGEATNAPLVRDESLLHHLRSLTVEQRLAWNDGAARAVLELRAAAARRVR